MKLEHTFEVAAPPDRVWDFLLDLEQVTPCMPGAELTDLPDERTWKGKLTVRLGAVKLAYAATVEVAERDDDARHVTLRGSGRETRGKGTASATIDSRVEPAGEGGAQVRMDTDLTISGAVAQYGRGMIADVSKRLTGEFARCLEARLAAEREPEPAVPADQGARAPVGAQPEAEPASGAAAAEEPPPAPEEAGAPQRRPERSAAGAPVAKPIGGIRLGLWALARALGRLLRRLVAPLRRSRRSP